MHQSRNQVCTLVCASSVPEAQEIFSSSRLNQAANAIEHLGGRAGAITWLDGDHTACDLFFDDLSLPQADAALRPIFGDMPVDLFVQETATRRKSMLVADMDSTMIAEESLDELAGHLGLRDHIAAITARAMRGEIDFRDAVRERVGLLAGLPESALAETLAHVTMTPGARTLVHTMRHNGARMVLISGGFTAFTGPVADMLGFHEHHGNELGLAGGKLTGTVIEPIRDKHYKEETLVALAARYQIPLTLTMAVGDGANDVPMLQTAGAGVAYHAKPVTAAAARFRVDYHDLTALLYMQGYAKNEWVDLAADA